MKRFNAVLILAIVFSVACSDSGSPTPEAASDVPLDEGLLEQIELPPGFEIELYATGLPGARSMTLTPGGTLFVGSRRLARANPVPRSAGCAPRQQR